VGADAHQDWRAAIASALEWWHEAGVDTLVDETARDWLTAPVVAPLPPVAPAAEAMPDTLEAFLAWRAGPAAPEAKWRGPLVPASGAADATIMVLTDCPDREDADAGLLNGGAAGRLFARMLAAIGLTREAVHVAPLFWRRPPPGHLPPATEEQLAAIARHHVALIAPKRVLLLGDAASRAMTGTNMIGARGTLRSLNHEGAETQTVSSLHPRDLIDRPAWKAGAWKDLQLLIGAEAQ
jgi:uracil-DNA glycosylase